MAKDPVEERIAQHPPTIAELMRALRWLVRETRPELPEMIDRDGVIRYGGTNLRDWTYYVSGHKAHANLGFARGASLPDPHGLVEGTGKNLRHVKVRRPEDVDRPGMRDLLRGD
jgi:hypothetical protein